MSDQRNHTTWALHNATWGFALIAYSLFVAPPLSPYSRSTALERQYGADYLRDVVRVDAKYYIVKILFDGMNYLDAVLLVCDAIGTLRTLCSTSPTNRSTITS